MKFFRKNSFQKSRLAGEVYVQSLFARAPETTRRRLVPSSPFRPCCVSWRFEIVIVSTLETRTVYLVS
jgi:hypothetical protein